MPNFSGHVERVLFRNEESGFVVARLQSTGKSGESARLLTIVGQMPGLQEGEVLRLQGEWERHRLHGEHLRVELYESCLPTATEDVVRYLAAAGLPGVGPATAERIVKHFGESTLDVLNREPERLREVSGISRRKGDDIRQVWIQQRETRALFPLLQSHGVGPALANRIREKYGDETLQVVKDDPYRLALEVEGIGFRTADAIARESGVRPEALSRRLAGLKHVLLQAAEGGHLYLERHDLLDKAQRFLDLGLPELEVGLLELLRVDQAILDRGRVYLPILYRSERGAAEKLQDIASSPSSLMLRESDAEGVIRRAEAAQGLELNRGQIEAVRMSLKSKVSVLTGGPGTGKTSSVRTVIEALELLEVDYVLCAPTGRAAKRLSEATGKAASTIHRLISYQPQSQLSLSFQPDVLTADYIIVDEMSMVDAVLFYQLLKAVPPEAHLLLVGDPDQLPSIGPGNVLSELIASEVIPVVTLTELFRQATGSEVVQAAHRVRQGTVPDAEQSGTDFFVIPESDEERAASLTEIVVSERIPMRFGLDPVEDIQVIAPMYSGPAGVTELNRRLQRRLNPQRVAERGIVRGRDTFFPGDKVMQTRNNYDKEVFNGDVGVVSTVDSQARALEVSYPAPGEPVVIPYEGSDLEELTLAYAVTVHKSQGSEYPALVVVLSVRHFPLLRRTLLYTAITRAQQLCVLVGDPKALRIAVNTTRHEERNTALGERLRRENVEIFAL